MGDIAAAALTSDIAPGFLRPCSAQILRLGICRGRKYLSLLTFVSKVRVEAFQSKHYFLFLRVSEIE